MNLSFRTWLEGWSGDDLYGYGGTDVEEAMEAVKINPGKVVLDGLKRKYRHGEFRGIIDNDETVYVWPAEYGDHHDIANMMHIDVAVYFYLTWDGKKWSVSTSKWSQTGSMSSADRMLLMHPRIKSWVS